MTKPKPFIQALLLTLTLFLIPHITAGIYTVLDIYVIGNFDGIYGRTNGSNLLGRMITAIMILIVPCTILGIGTIASTVIRRGVNRRLIKSTVLLNIFLIALFFIVNNGVLKTPYGSEQVGILFLLITASLLFLIPIALSSAMIIRSRKERS